MENSKQLKMIYKDFAHHLIRLERELERVADCSQYCTFVKSGEERVIFDSWDQRKPLQKCLDYLAHHLKVGREGWQAEMEDIIRKRETKEDIAKIDAQAKAEGWDTPEAREKTINEGLGVWNDEKKRGI